MKVKKRKEYFIVYTVGSVGYGMIEMLWRGFTHWSMLFTGGISMLCLYVLNIRKYTEKHWKKCLYGSGMITIIEFLVGFLINRVLHLNVWDYSKKRGNVAGQICPQYSFLWFLLSFPVLLLCKKLRKGLIKD